MKKSRKYDENQLWNVETKEALTWVGKNVLVKLKDGCVVCGKIKEIGLSSTPNIDNEREHLWVSLTIDRAISITNILCLELL